MARQLVNRRNKLWAPKEVARQVAFVSDLRARGLSIYEIARRAKKELGIGKYRTSAIVHRVDDRIKQELAQDLPYHKSRQVDRLMRYIAELQGERDAKGKWKKEPDYNALLRAEALLADMVGTKAPQTVVHEHQFNQAVAHVLYNFTPEQTKEMLEEELELERMANAYRQLPAPNGMKGSDGPGEVRGSGRSEQAAEVAQPAAREAGAGAGDGPA